MVNNFLAQSEKYFSFLRYRFRYLLNYIAIGFLAVLLETIIVVRLADHSVSSYISIPVGFVSGLILSFILNSTLNFKVPRSKNLRTFIIFTIISSISLLLNLFLINLFSNYIVLSYSLLRFSTAGLVFILSYLAHRKITFNFIRKVGIAVYLSRNESISGVYNKIKYYSDFIHLDIIDSTVDKEAKEIDLSLIKQVQKTWLLRKMIHIMSRKPSIWINKIHPYVDTIIFHKEISENIDENINLCRKLGKKVGIALELDTPVKDVIPYLDKIDFVQIMGIKELGRSGQRFMTESLAKVKKLKSLKKKHKFEIIFDGGVKPTNISRINADYIIAASSLLSSDNPVKSFLELKTSARYRDIKEELRKDIVEEIKKGIETLSFVKSGTLVGSFAESNSLEGISDIDIVVIADELTKEKYQIILDEFTKRKEKLESKYGYNIFINNTFGPLKFHEDNIVFHLMVYDEKSHIDHCKKSPFTCLDWQRSPLFVKKPMSEIYKVRTLQPNSFFNARRSAEEYVHDLREGRISYREYSYKGKNIIENKKYKEMNRKDRVEFSYHVVKFIMTNFLKLYTGHNRNYSWKELNQKYFDIFPLNRDLHLNLISALKENKARKNYNIGKEIIDRVEMFVKDFEGQFRNNLLNGSKRITFFRHAKTKMNKKNLFLGSRSDPNIIHDKIENGTLKAKIEDADIIVSSPAKRCKSTVKALTKKEIVTDDRIREIDYGLIDGKDLEYLSKNYPQILKAWEFGEDPRFPEGENYQDVIDRIKSFFSQHESSNHKKIAACTHNVVLRIVLGYLLKIPMKDWFKINVPHVEAIDVIITKDKKRYLDLNEEQINYILANFKNG